LVLFYEDVPDKRENIGLSASKYIDPLTKPRHSKVLLGNAPFLSIMSSIGAI
jgi:hypothetical protein